MPITQGLPVSAERQLAFLRQISRILDEGKFTSTYKFALLLSLTNIAVKNGDDSDAELTVQLDDVAREFVKLYWGMAQPYPDEPKDILLQNRQASKPAKVITLLAPYASTGYARHTRHRVHAPAAASVVATTRKTIAKDVLYRLQTVGPSIEAAAVRSDRFLYEHPSDAAGCATLTQITLKPGVAACMRSLRTVIAAMVQARWALWVRDHNPSLGPDRNLEAFLFGTNRVPLREYAAWLYELQGARCFYTHAKLASPDAGAVDHFLPRARYVLDEPVNLVLASTKANGDKSDHVASEAYLKLWAERNTKLHLADLPDSFAARLAPGALPATWQDARSVAAWMYAAAERDGVQAWNGEKQFARVGRDWRGILGVG